jgi:polyisoprenoid-binding protein YceI
MKLINKALFVFSLAVTGNTYGQSEVPSSYKVTIHGTSNLHDWDEKVENVTTKAIITRNANKSISISALNVTIQVKSIKSTEGSIMDKNTYKALKEPDFPQIKYVLLEPVNSISTTSGVYTFKAKGNITIAGVTKPVIIAVKIHADGQKLIFEGTEDIKMTDYNVKPPVALLGTLKTGNNITINYNIVF